MNHYLRPFVWGSIRVLTFSQLLSCKTGPGADRKYPGGENIVYALKLSPEVGSEYHYDISNESNYKIEVDERKVENLNRSVVGIEYSINKDSAGNFLFGVGYDKVHLYSKNGDTETERDADNAANSIDPAEKMLGFLKQEKFTTVINSKGDVVSNKGYDELKAKVMTEFGPENPQAKKIVGDQWDKQIRDGLLKRNMDQFFKVFPDSAVHVGDEWVINNVQQDQINVRVKTRYKLEKIQDGIAVIKMDGTISSDSTAGYMSGYQFTADLKGTEEGELQLEAKTGMLISNDFTGDIKGTMNVMSRNIPVIMHMSVKAAGKRIR